MNARSLVAAFSPIQDLHGQASPYPAGGGKNKLSYTPIHLYGAPKDAQYDSTHAIWLESGSYVFSFSGIIGATSWRTCLFLFDTNGDRVYSGSDIMAGGTYGGNEYGRYYVNGRDGTILVNPFTLNVSCYVQICFLSGDTAETNVMTNPMVESGSTATAYAPYSNICPIGGRTGVTVTRTGKNLLNNTDLFTWGNWSATVAPDGDMKSLDGNRIFTFPKLEAGKTYVISFGFVGSTFPTYLYFGYHKDGTATRLAYITTDSLLRTEFSFTAVDGYNYCLRMGNTDTQTRFDNQIAKWSNCQLEIGSTASAYEPYTGTTYPVSWQTEAGTVYGGTLDPLNRKLVVTSIKSDLNFDTYGDNGIVNGIQRFTHNYSDKQFGLSGMISNLFYQKNANEPYAMNGRTASGLIEYTVPLDAIGASAEQTSQQRIDAVVAWLANNPSYVVYPLATPIEYTLSDDVDVTMLLGVNNIWATGDTVYLTYPCDTKLYIERLTQPTEDDMVANANIQSGKYFMIGNSLFYSTQAIAQGSAIVVGTNCTALSLADALNALN